MSKSAGHAPGGKRRQRPTEGGLDIMKIGGNIYEAFPVDRIITASGGLDTDYYTLPEPFRLNKVEVARTDANGASSGAAWLCDLHMEEPEASGVWRPIFERAVTLDNIVEELGVEYNWRSRRVRIRTMGVTDHIFRPVFTLQFLEGVPFS